MIGFSDQGTFQTSMQFAKTLPSIKEEKTAPPTVLVFGAQAMKGIVKEEHPYVSTLSFDLNSSVHELLFISYRSRNWFQFLIMV